MRVSYFLAVGIFLAGINFTTVSAKAEGSDEVQGEIVKTRTLTENRRSPAILKLNYVEPEMPVLDEELEVVHTEKIHLLIIDPSLTDYHHQHPQPMNIPGEYIFTMTPKSECGYRIWADIDTINGEQQYVTSDIAGVKDCSDQQINRRTNTVYEDDNYRFTLELDTGSLSVGKDTMAKLTVREKGGRYVTELQPIMGTFAHMVGFYDDYQNIAHLHPMGDNPEDDYDLGGPVLNFHIRPTQGGYLKLFAQFKINDLQVFAPFGLDVAGGAYASAVMDDGMDEEEEELSDPFAMLEFNKTEEVEEVQVEEEPATEDAWEQKLQEMAKQRRKAKKVEGNTRLNILRKSAGEDVDLYTAPGAEDAPEEDMDVFAE